jgi:DinB superfamily
MTAIGAVLDELESSRRRISAALVRLSRSGPHQRVGDWSPRDVAAHLAASERECFEPRIRAIAGGGQPRFDFYSNDDRDFSAIELDSALEEWAATRARLTNYVRSLSRAELANVGFHGEYGELTVPSYLAVAIDHDREHLRDLERAPVAPADPPGR